MKLDVGCGANPRGDVNTDLYVHDTENHRNNGNDTLNAKAIPNLVVCEATKLPFRAKAFSEVFCAQLIEHLPHPIRLMAELVRVCAGRITVETVHRFGEMLDYHGRKWYKQHHVSKFNVKWFTQAARILKCNQTNSYVISYQWFPNATVRLIWVPYGFGVTWQT